MESDATILAWLAQAGAALMRGRGVSVQRSSAGVSRTSIYQWFAGSK